MHSRWFSLVRNSLLCAGVVAAWATPPASTARTPLAVESTFFGDETDSDYPMNHTDSTRTRRFQVAAQTRREIRAAIRPRLAALMAQAGFEEVADPARRFGFIDGEQRDFVFRTRSQEALKDAVAMTALIGSREEGRLAGTLDEVYVVLTIWNQAFDAKGADFNFWVRSYVQGSLRYRESGRGSKGIIDENFVNTQKVRDFVVFCMKAEDLVRAADALEGFGAFWLEATREHLAAWVALKRDKGLSMNAKDEEALGLTDARLPVVERQKQQLGAAAALMRRGKDVDKLTRQWFEGTEKDLTALQARFVVLKAQHSRIQEPQSQAIAAAAERCLGHFAAVVAELQKTRRRVLGVQ